MTILDRKQNPRLTSSAQPTSLAGAVKLARYQANLTQEAVAELAGLGLKTVRTIEQGKEGVSLANVNILLEFLGLELVVTNRIEARRIREELQKP